MKFSDLSRESVVRLGMVSFLLFSQAIPTMFISNAVPTIYRAHGLDLSQFWFFAIPTIPRWLKWLMAPYVDRTPLLRIGLRRSWMLVFTSLACASYGLLAFVPPTVENLYWLVFLLFVIELIAAVLDISVDAYTIESLQPRERSLSGPVFEIAKILSFAAMSAIVMVAYDQLGWQIAILVMSLLFAAGFIPVILRPEPISVDARALALAAHGSPSLRRALLRENAKYLFGLVAIGAIYTSFGFELFNVMLVDKGLSVGEIGIAAGTGVTIGALVGLSGIGALLTRYSLKQLALIACVGIIIGHALQVWLSIQITVTLPVAIAAYFVTEILVSPHFALVSSARVRWTTRRQAGTDFTLQSSVRAVGLFAGSAAAGPFADLAGWPAYFSLGMIVGLLATLMLYLIHDRMEDTSNREDAEDRLLTGARDS